MNPFVQFAEHPVAASALFAYALILVAALLATTYVFGRNVLTLIDRWQKEAWPSTTPLYPPGGWMLRVIAIPVILAVDVLLVGALVWVFA